MHAATCLHHRSEMDATTTLAKSAATANDAATLTTVIREWTLPDSRWDGLLQWGSPCCTRPVAAHTHTHAPEASCKRTPLRHTAVNARLEHTSGDHHPERCSAGCTSLPLLVPPGMGIDISRLTRTGHTPTTSVTVQNTVQNKNNNHPTTTV